jgi:hypothetical protein
VTPVTNPSRPFSDSTLDALAAAAPEPLGRMIVAHRIAYGRDLYIPRTTTETPPVFIDPDTGKELADPMAMTGPTLSYAMLAYLHATGPFPWTRAFGRMRANCRRLHTRGHNERPEWRGSLCGALTALVIRQGYTFERACYQLYLTTDRAETVLRGALEAIRSRMIELGEEVQYVGPLIPEPVPVHEHHRDGLGGLHALECHHPVCRARRKAAA